MQLPRRPDTIMEKVIVVTGLLCVLAAVVLISLPLFDKTKFNFRFDMPLWWAVAALTLVYLVSMFYHERKPPSMQGYGKEYNMTQGCSDLIRDKHFKAAFLTGSLTAALYFLPQYKSYKIDMDPGIICALLAVVLWTVYHG